MRNQVFCKVRDGACGTFRTEPVTLPAPHVWRASTVFIANSNSGILSVYLTFVYLLKGYHVIAGCFDFELYRGLNENGPQKLLGMRTIRRCELVGSVSLGVGFEVSDAQGRPSVSFSSSCL